MTENGAGLPSSLTPSCCARVPDTYLFLCPQPLFLRLGVSTPEVDLLPLPALPHHGIPMARVPLRDVIPWDFVMWARADSHRGSVYQGKPRPSVVSHASSKHQDARPKFTCTHFFGRTSLRIRILRPCSAKCCESDVDSMRHHSPTRVS